MTYEQLEMRLRQKQVARISHVKTATIEANGEIGIELMEHAQPVTKAEFQKLMDRLNPILPTKDNSETFAKSPNIFEEVENAEEASPIH